MIDSLDTNDDTHENNIIYNLPDKIIFQIRTDTAKNLFVELFSNLETINFSSFTEKEFQSAFYLLFDFVIHSAFYRILPTVDKRQYVKQIEKFKEDRKRVLSRIDFTPNYKKRSIPTTLKRIVWNFWIGEEIGKTKCMCCKLTDITQLAFNCGHIIAESKGGELKMENLKPICQSCNSSMGKQNMHEFIQKYGF